MTDVEMIWMFEGMFGNFSVLRFCAAVFTQRYVIKFHVKCMLLVCVRTFKEEINFFYPS
jgi:hypothetical protein